jgi:acetolactate synthase-1/2/3 large subunit
MGFQSGGTLLAQALVRNGHDRLFALHGGHLDEFLFAAVDTGISLIDTRHEAAAVHAADGFARSTGRTGVATVTSGPGVTNAVTGVAVAHVDSIPMLVIGGAPPVRDDERYVLQGGVDQLALMTPVTKLAKRVTSAARIPEMVDLALRTARRGRPGPVYLEVPIDVLYSVTDEAQAWQPGPVVTPRPMTIAAKTADDILEMLAAAERPIVFAGSGVTFSGAQDVVRQFAELTSTPVFANSRGLGALPRGHRLWGGNIANLGVAGAPDLVLTVGARMSGLSVGSQRAGALSHRPRVVQVDIDGAEIGRNFEVDLPVVGDVATVVQALVERAGTREWDPREGWATRCAAASDPTASFAAEAATHQGAVHPYRMAAELAAALEPDAIVVGDGSECYHWVEPAAPNATLGSWLGHGYFGCLGIGMPYAVGAQVAHPGRQVATIVGDGSMGFNLAEFDTMARHGLPVLTVVSSNLMWGMSAHGQDILKGRRVISELPLVRYDLIAENMGGHGEFVTEADQLAGAFKRALASGKPSCVNVLVDGSVLSPRVRAMEKLDLRPSVAPDGTIADEIVIPYYEPVRTR